MYCFTFDVVLCPSIVARETLFFAEQGEFSVGDYVQDLQAGILTARPSRFSPRPAYTQARNWKLCDIVHCSLNNNINILWSDDNEWFYIIIIIYFALTLIKKQKSNIGYSNWRNTRNNLFTSIKRSTISNKLVLECLHGICQSHLVMQIHI